MCDASAWASSHVARSRRRAGRLQRIDAGPAHSSTCWTSRPITSVNLAPQSGRLLRGTHPPSVNTLIKKALGRPGVDDHLETIFARGIDPESEAMSIARGNPAWPSRAEVRQYVEAADRLIEQAIERADLERPGDPLLDHGRALWTILEHEEMHQETLGYIWHQLPYSQKRKPSGYHTVPLSSPHAAPSLHARMQWLRHTGD